MSSAVLLRDGGDVERDIAREVRPEAKVLSLKRGGHATRLKQHELGVCVPRAAPGLRTRQSRFSGKRLEEPATEAALSDWHWHCWLREGSHR